MREDYNSRQNALFGCLVAIVLAIAYFVWWVWDNANKIDTLHGYE